VLYGKVAVRTAADALRMSTIDAARALDMADEIGSLEPGKKADLILVDVTTSWANPLRTENLISNLVYNACGRDVTDVFVDGEQLVKDGALTKLDEKEIIADAQKGAEEVWGRSKHLFAAEGMRCGGFSENPRLPKRVRRIQDLTNCGAELLVNGIA
jgi:5-methylthioadenosine/S-adenosylhomocysteine deaminase